MKKIVRLTENELVRLIKKIVKEQEFDYDMVSSFAGRERGGEPSMEKIDDAIMIRNKSEEEVNEILSNIPEHVKFISIIDCEFADFSEVELCSSNIVFVRIVGTPSNFKSQEYPCIEEEIDDGFYSFNN